jgi:glycosyltransferase family protein
MSANINLYNKEFTGDDMRDSKLKRDLVKIWNSIYDVIQLYHVRKSFAFSIMPSAKTIRYIKQTNCSVARFGDGEFGIMLRQNGPTFQQATDEMAVAIAKVFDNIPSNLLICLPRAFISTRGLKVHGKRFWNGWSLNNLPEVTQAISPFVGKKYRFGDANISRPYSPYTSNRKAQKLFPMLKSLWEERDILFIEGEKTRLGVGNDLFSNAKSIKRILCPAENAFDVYDRILETVKVSWRGELVILALGPTATVLASDLSKLGIQALDLGHIDIQYEWYLGGTSFVPVKGKYTNETLDGRQPEDCVNSEYLSQIIAEVK